MTDKNKIAYSEYSEVVAKIKELEAKKDMLAEVIYGNMTKDGLDQVKSDYGTFYFTVRKTWTYPEDVKEVEAILKAKKKEYETNGKATFEEKKSLAYKQSNGDANF
jgi:hypothetical protein